MIIGNEVVDLSPLFNANPVRNYLLSALGIFDGVGVQHHKVEVSRLIEDNLSLLNIPTARFSREHNTTARQSDKSWLIELPYFLREDSINVADVAGRRKQGSTLEETVVDISSDYMAKHFVAFQRTKESYLARALFKGEVYSPKTNDLLIDFGATFGISPMTATFDLSASDATSLRQIDDLVTQITEASQAQASAVERIIIFAKGDFYSNLRFSEGMQTAMKYVSPFDNANVVIARRDLLPGISTFSIPGTNCDVVKVSDQLLLQHFPDGVDAIAVPVFQAGANVWQNIYGAATSNFALINAAPAETYSWSYGSERGDVVNLITENSALTVPHGLGFTVHITAS